MKMKQNKKQIFILLNFILLLMLTFFSAWKEEEYRKKEAFYLKLTPVDPRSLLQGDYMILNYEIVEKAREKIRLLEEKNQKIIKRGFIVISLDKNRIAEFKDVLEEPYSDADLLFIAFRSNGSIIKINADSFLFQEGTSELYNKVQYSKVVLVNSRLRLLDVMEEIE